MSAILTSFVISVLAANLDRSYDWLHEEINELNREADYSVDLDTVETEFQRALQDQIDKKVGEHIGDSLSEAIDSWDLFVHELYELESASGTVEEIESSEHDWLAVKTEKEAVDRIVDTWIQLAERGRDESIPRQPVRSVVIEAYNESINQFHKEIAGTDLADEALLGSIEDLRERLASLADDYSEANVYKSRKEFERLSTLFDRQPDYVPVSAERETINIEPENDTVKVDDAKEELLRLLDDGIDLISVSGEGGTGKSRLLAAAGKDLENRDNCDVYYVTSPIEKKALPLDRDTVLFVDDFGRKDMEYFLRKAVPEERNQSKRDHSVQVVIATRSVYDEKLETIVNGLGTIDKRTLWLATLDEANVAELIEHYGLDEDTVDRIVDRSDGNPFFALLLAKLATKRGDDRLTIKDALANVIGEMTSSEADLDQVAEIDSANAVERWLEGLALWQYYVEPDDEALITKHVPEFESPSARRRQLDALTNNGYLDRTNKPKDGGFEYSHRYDVLADYLRFEVIERDLYFPYLQGNALSKKAPAIAQGIVDLHASPLSRLYADMNEEIEGLVEWLAEEILEADHPLHRVLEAERHLMRVAPEHVPLDELLNRIDPTYQPDALGDAVATFTAATFEHIDKLENISQVDKWLACANRIHDEGGIDNGKYAQLLAHATVQYGNIKQLQEVEHVVEMLRELPESTAPVQIAFGLSNATTIYGRAKHFSKLEGVLSEIRKLYNNYPELNIQLPLATGLTNAAAGYGGLGLFEKSESALSELRELHEENPENQVRKHLAMALANAVADYGEAKRFEDVEKMLSKFRQLHDNYPKATVREEFAIGLYNATRSFGEARNFDDMEAVLTELEELHEEYQETAIREEFADGLSDAAGHYGEMGRVDDVKEKVMKLRKLHSEYPEGEIRGKLAEGLLNMLVCYESTSCWAELEDVLSDLRKLHERYPEAEVRKPLMIGLVKEVGRLCVANQWGEVEAILTELHELHENHPGSNTRAYLASGLTYATEESINEKRFNPIAEYISDLLSLADNYGDLGGFERQEKFLSAFQVLTADLCHHVPETAIDAVEMISIVTDENSWLKFQVEFGQVADQLYDDDVISIETYKRLLTRL